MADGQRALPRRMGSDLLEEEYVSRQGLRVMHILRNHGVPDVDAWAATYPHADGRIYMDAAGTGHLWLWWKE